MRWNSVARTTTDPTTPAPAIPKPMVAALMDHASAKPSGSHTHDGKPGHRAQLGGGTAPEDGGLGIEPVRQDFMRLGHGRYL